MINSKEARELALKNEVQEQTKYTDKIVKFIDKIDETIREESKKGKLYCKVSCIDEYSLRTDRVFGYYYNNKIIAEVKKRLTNLGFRVKIKREKYKKEPDYTSKCILISWN